MVEQTPGARNREKRREMQKQRILNVTGRLFRKNGYLGTSVDEIAAKLRMNKASIYYYFKDKATLLYKLIMYPMIELAANVESIANSSLKPTEKLKQMIEQHVSYALSHLNISGIGHLERKNLPPKLRKEYVAMRDGYEAIYRTVIREGIEKGEFAFDDEKMHAMLSLDLMNSIALWYNPKGKYGINEMAAFVSGYILKALGCNNLEGKRK